MNTTHPSRPATYASGYAKGRRAAQENDTVKNPFRAGGPAFHGWNDGHYDERSARRLAIDRHSAELWKFDTNSESALPAATAK